MQRNRLLGTVAAVFSANRRILLSVRLISPDSLSVGVSKYKVLL